ncbi:hypothetical protein IWW37_002566 [Coemansia sp. RSA 2050]|nr:hypothetical protein IWW37_002566 [Coemansia sp. RSA 2050]KAJ2732370.1 hypothetical protein IW152_003843 [Coemansia sp. BCRC 34962]
MANSNSMPRLTLTMRLASPLPARKFLFVCQQKTVKELKKEIRRRLTSLIKEPVSITVDGYELMDDDDVADVLSKDVQIDVHLTSSLEEAIVEQEKKAVVTPKDTRAKASGASPSALLTIRKREHGRTKGGELAKRAKPLRVYPAELAYEQAKVEGPGSECTSEDGSSDLSSEEEDEEESSDSGSSGEHPVKVPLGRLSMTSADDEDEA